MNQLHTHTHNAKLLHGGRKKRKKGGGKREKEREERKKRGEIKRKIKY